MFSSPLAATAVLLSALTLANGQTFTDCDPTKKTCPADPGLGKSSSPLFTDFTKGASKDWTLAEGTTLSYSSAGAQFQIHTSTQAPTISSEKYIMFGQVDVFLKASPGTGIVSSFILESDDLDEIDWEWLGSTDTSVESNFFGKGNTTTYDRAIYHPVTTPIETYRNYSIKWTAESTIWSIDGAVVRTLPFGDPKALYGANYPQTPMRIKMGNWVGCVDAAAAADPKTKGTCDWAGGPADFSNTASNPWTMLVANVTIYDFGCGGDYTYSDLSGSWQSINCSGGSSSSNNANTGSSVTSSAKSSSTTTPKSTSGGVLAQTSASVDNTTAKTTLSSATSSSTAKTTSSSTTSSGPAQATTSDSNSIKPKHKYGVVDFAVLALGLGLGYLVM